MAPTLPAPAPALSGAARLAARARVLGGAVQARLGRAVVRFLATRVCGFRLEITGQEHIPAGEPLIVAAGPHRSWLDPFLAIIAFPTAPRLCFLGSAGAMFNTRWKRAVLTAFGGVVPVDLTGQHHRESIVAALAILDRGDRLGVFPEGPGKFETDPMLLHEYKRGIAYLSQRSGRRVVPVAIAGTQELWRGKTLRLAIGAPLPALPAEADRQAQAAHVAMLHAATLALLPPQPVAAPRQRRRWSGLTRLLT